MQYWLFGALTSYDLVEKVPELANKGDYWVPACHRNDMAEGDHVILWQHGPRAGVYAFGKLTSKAYKRGGEWRVDIAYDPLLKQPVFKRDLRKHASLRNLSEKMKRNNPVIVKPNEWHALKELISKDTLNIFTGYGQEENQFTNGLVSLLELSRHTGTPLAKLLLTTLAKFVLKEEIKSFRVLRGIDGTADAELCGSDCCIRFETKIEAGPLDLRKEQIPAHLERLERSPQALKVLVLLTPDDGNSDYIKRILSNKSIKAFCRKGKHHVLHLEWRHVYEFLKDSVAKDEQTVFNQLELQFLRQIHDRIFDQDFAGIIQKIAFGDWTEVYPYTTKEHDGYLDEMKRGEWTCWHTPREYKKLNGTGRKLLLYDKKREAITVQVEIQQVRKMKRVGGFPWRNSFVSKTLRFDKGRWIPLPRILKVPGFENFTSGRAAAWNVTQEQYRLLTAPADRDTGKQDAMRTPAE